MKIPVPDSLFVRLFLLLFFILSISHFAGREIFLNLGLEHSVSVTTPQHHPFRMVSFLARLAAVALTAWVAARWLSNPIKRMARAADELGKNLNSLPIDETSGPSEVRQASKIFNQMQTHLKQQMEERNRFLAAVSHDLRTPLTRLKLRAEKIGQQELRSDVQSDINEMAGIIDTTLDYLRGGEQPEATCLLDIGALVHSFAEDAKECGDVISVSGNASPIRLQPLATRRCLNNLLENALRYGERATIVIGETDNEVVITIHDAGPGIPEDKLEAVFAPFYRLDASRSRHTGGIGLGLSIAREMARKQGGNVTLKNAPEGGLVATLVLPKRY
ncbi:MAG: HAMP domain-containing protein [Betaproteobacteria bacterium]|nr:HAMP domain-containing protein [Betaproteobacteria bacterium]